MADFEAQVKAVLDTSNLESQLKGLGNTPIELRNFQVDRSSLGTQLQTAINQTNFTLTIGNVQFRNAGNLGRNLGRDLTETIERQLDTGGIEASIARVFAQYQKLGGTTNTNLNGVAANIARLNTLQAELWNNRGTAASVDIYRDFNNVLATVRNNLSTATEQSKQFASALQITTLDNKMQQWLNQNTSASEQFRTRVSDLQARLRELSNAGTVSTGSFKNIENGFKEAAAGAEQSSGAFRNFATTITGAIRQMTGFYSAIQVLRQGVQLMKNMAKEVTAVDTAMTGLYRVTNLTDAGYSKLYSNMVNSAKEYGATLSDIIDATTTWVKLGFEADVAQKLGNVTTMYQHVADLDTDTAVKNLVTAYKGFEGQLLELTGGDSAAAVEYVADIFDKLNNEFAVTASGVGQGLTNCASALQVAGNSIQQSAAMLTGITEVTQNASKAGAALRMLSMRLRGTTAKELEELGEDTEGVIEVTSKLQKTIKDLSGVDITDVNGQLRSTYDIMNDLASVWDELGANQQANVLETIAGKNRASDVAALIRNWDQVKAAFEASNNAWGTAANEQGIYIDSIQGKMDQLKASWQAFANDFISSDFLKFGVDNLKGLVDILDVVVQRFGSLGTIGTGILVFSVFRRAIPELSMVAHTLDEIGWSAGNLRDGVSTLGQSFRQFMRTPLGVASAIGAVTLAISAAISAYQNYKQKQAEERQEKIDNAQATQREIDQLTNLYNEYYKAQAAYENGVGSKEAYISSTEALCQNLGIESEQVAGLIEQYNGLDEAYQNSLRTQTISKLNDEIKELTKGLEPAKEALVDLVDGSILGFGAKNMIDSNHEELGDVFAKKLEDAGLISRGSYNSKTGGFAIVLGNDGATDTIEDAVAIYQDAQEMLNVLESGIDEKLYTREQLSASRMYNKLTSIIAELQPAYDEYQDIVSDLNNDLAQKQILEWMGTNEIPTSVAAYKDFRQEMINTAMSSGTFVGSQEQIAQAVDDTVASMAAFNKIAEQTQQYDAVSEAFQKSAFGKGLSLNAAEHQYDEMMNWYDGLSDKEKELVYKVTISTPDVSDFDLSDWQKILDSAIETSSIDMSDLFSDDNFKEGLEKYQSDIDKLHEYKQKIVEGTFTDEDAAALIQLHPEFADTEDFGAAIDQELQNLIGTTYDREYKENVIVDLTPITPDGDVLSPEELEDYFNYLVDSGDILAADKDIEHGGLGLVVNLEPVTDDLDTAFDQAEARTQKLHQQQEQYYLDNDKSIGKEMQDSVNGNVDLLARQQVEAAELVKKGWEDAGEGIATLYSSSFSAGDTSLFTGLKGFLDEYRSTLSEDQLPGFDKWAGYILNAAAAAEKGKTSIEQLSDAISGVQKVSTLFSDMRAFNATGDGDFTQMYQQVYALAQKAGGSIGDAIDMSTGRAKFNLDIINEWADSYYEAMYGIEDVSDEQADGLIDWIEKTEEATQKTEALSNVLSGVGKANDWLTKSKSGELDYLDSLQAAAEMAEDSGKEMGYYLKEGLNGELTLDDTKVTEWAESLVDTLADYGFDDEEIANIKIKIGAEVETKSAEDEIKAALTKITDLQDALTKLRSGEGLSDKETIELYIEYPELKDYSDLESGLEAVISSEQTSLNNLIDKWAELNNVPTETVERVKEAIKGIGDTSEDSSAALERLSTALSRISDLNDALSKSQSGDLGIMDVLETAQKIAEDNGGTIMDYITGGAEGYKLNESYISKLRSQAIMDMPGLDDETKRNVLAIKEREDAYDSLQNTMSRVAKASDLIKDANDEITKSGKNSLDSISSLMDLYGQDWAKYVNASADGKGFIIDTNAIKQNMLSAIDEIQDATPEMKQSLKDSLEIEFDSATFSDSVDSYVSSLNTLSEALTKIRSGDFTSSDIYDLVSQFPQLAGSLDDLDGGIMNLMSTMGSDIISKFKERLNDPNLTEEARAQIEGLLQVVLQLQDEAANVDIRIDIDAEKSGLEAVTNAISESMSATGLSAESVKKLTERYKGLGNANIDELFAKTTHGIVLNAQALADLEKSYSDQNISEIDSQLQRLITQYQLLSEEIQETTDVEKQAELTGQLNQIASQIDQVSSLASEYRALTSDYNQWMEALNTPNQDEAFNNAVDGFEKMQELFKVGKVGTDDFIQGLEYFTGKDFTWSSTGEKVDAYNNGKKTWERYMKGGKDGNQGARNFLSDLEKNGFATLLDDGSYKIDTNDIDELASSLGIGPDFAKDLLSNLNAYDFKIKFDGEFDFKNLEKKAQSAADKLKELGLTDGFEFNLKSRNVDDLNNQISKAKEIAEEFYQYDENGNVIGFDLEVEGAEEAQYLLQALIIRRQELEKPAILKVDTTGASTEIQQAVEKINQFNEAKNKFELENPANGGSGVSAETLSGLKTAAQELNNLPDEVKTKFNIDSTEVQSAIDNIEAAEVPAEIDPTAISTITAAIQAIDPGEIELQTNADTVQQELSAVNEYTIDDKSFTVTVTDEATDKLSSIESQVVALDGKTVTITTQVKTEGEPTGDGSTPEQSSGSTVTIKYVPDYSEIEGSTPPSPADGTVKFNADTSAVDAVPPAQKSGTVTFDVNDSAVQNYTVPAKTGKVTYTATMSDWTPPTKTGKVIYTPVMSGGAGALGTTSGKAFKSGNWGTKDSGTALMAEVGPELIVRDGRFFTVGDNGAGFFKYKRGDIIFNADQTRELFENGRVLSNNGRGKIAYAEGTAFADGAHGNGGGFWGTGGGSSGSSGGSGKKPSSGSSPSKPSTSSEKKGKEKIDWIEIAIDRIERAIESLERIADSAFQTLSTRLSYNADEIAKTTEEIALQQEAYERYIKEADSVKLKDNLKELVRDGTIDISKYKKKTADLIKEYQEWYRNMPCHVAIHGGAFT